MPHNIKKETITTLHEIARGCMVLLTLAFLASFAASYWWLADLLRNMTVQFFAGALLLTLFFAFTKKKKSFLLAIAITAITFAAIMQPYKPLTQATGGNPSLSVMHFNRLVIRQNHDDLKTKITGVDPDIIILQEANDSLSQTADELKGTYPYQIIKLYRGAFGMIILSKHPIIEHQIIDVPGPYFPNYTIRSQLAVPSIDQPVILYALHAMPPMDHLKWVQRNIELDTVAKKVSAETSPYVIMAGDWNVTHYSPFFKQLLSESGLTYRRPTLYPVTTWPAHYKNPLFQITIDYVLAKPALALTGWQRLPALDSDHYGIIARFEFAQL